MPVGPVAAVSQAMTLVSVYAGGDQCIALAAKVCSAFGDISF